MPPDQHDNPAEEPSSTSSPGRPKDPVAGGTRIGRSPGSDIIVAELGVSKQHAELRRSPTGGFTIVDLGSHNGTYVNGTRVYQQELNEGDIIAIGQATFRLTGGELIRFVDRGTDEELLAGMIATRLEQWLELEGVFEVPDVGRIELAGEVGWEPGSGTLYLRRLDGGKVWRVDVPVAARPATPDEVKTALQRERDLAAELRGQLDAREQRIDSLQAELRDLAAGNPALLPVLDRLGITPEPEV